MNENNNDETAVQICRPFRSILDSSLIVATDITEYNTKIIDCNNYIQVYFFPRTREKKDTNLEKIDTDDLVKPENNKKTKKELELSTNIELKNIIRSKLQCQRLAKCNCDEWKSFITLTIAENITNVDIANKRLKYFLDKVRRKYKNFKYIGIPEFQERGAVHYHLLCNIEINSEIIPKRPIKKIWNRKSKRYKDLIYYDIKYWLDGFSEAEPIDNDIKKIVGYISKYMTDDIDNRLFNRHRYFYSRNLKKPIVSYLDLSNNKHFDYYQKILNNKKIIYENEYVNPYTETTINFKEFL